MVAPLGAHASALMNLRSKSLIAYGLDPHALTVQNNLALIKVEGTRILARVKKEERALLVENEHSLVIA